MAGRSARTRRIVECGVALGLLLSVTPGATAGKISSSEVVVPDEVDSAPTQTVRYEAAPGERNDVRLRVTADAVTLYDGVQPVAAGRNCVQEASGVARCPLSAGQSASASFRLRALIDLGDGGDVLVVQQAVGRPSVEVDGGAGADRLSASAGCCVQLLGGSGPDVLRSDAGSSRLLGGGGPDVLSGGPGRDVLDGGGGTDVLRGGAGNDVLQGDDIRGVPKGDAMDGEAGTDTVTYAGARTPVFIDLRHPRRAGRADEHDRLRSIEGVQGGAGPDVLIGDHRSNRLEGGEGADRLLGLGGADELDGGRPGAPQPDLLRGGSGDDALQPLGSRLDCGPGQDVVPMGFGAGGVPPVPDTCEWAGELWTPIQFATTIRLKGNRLLIRVRSRTLQAVWLDVSARWPEDSTITTTGRWALEPFAPKEVSLPLNRAGRRAAGRALPAVTLDFAAVTETFNGDWESWGTLPVVRGP